MINSILIPVGAGAAITALAYGVMMLSAKAFDSAGNRAKRRRLKKLYDPKGRNR